MSAQPDTQVIIAGGGPCGLVLAIELGRRGIATVVLNERAATTPFPQANASQARTMEHYRRLGIADAVRAIGLPPDYTTDAAYFTRISMHEIARLEMPSSAEAGPLIRTMTGSWSAAELPHRGAQMYFERVLHDKAASYPSVSLAYGWRVTGFTETAAGVSVATENAATGETKQVSGLYLVGCDGPRSVVRRQLGIDYEGKSGVVRDFMGGRMLQVYLRAPGVYDLVRGRRKAWQYWAVNRGHFGVLTAVNGNGEFVFVLQLRPGQDEKEITQADIHARFCGVLGAQCPLEIINTVPWTAGLVLVAQEYARGRVFLGGDAAHLFTPSGGLGYNTAVEDAANLGWKLAALVQGWGGPGLAASYQAEMQPIARRNTAFADSFADRIGALPLPPELEDDTPAGAAARATVGAYWSKRARDVLDIPGVTFGARCDDSPLIASEGKGPPPDHANVYVPTALPGGRAPHAWLSDGRSLFDTFGRDFTLLRLGSADPEPLVGAAARRGIPLAVVELPDRTLRDLYEAELALIRPDQIVAWRGMRAPSDADGLLARVTGH